MRVTKLPQVIPPGEPDLVKALLRASRQRGARYVNRYEGIEGWHTSDVLPRCVAAYFRVAGYKVWIRTEDDVEFYWGGIVEGQLIQESTVNGKPAGR